jgi:hypothetical protein
MLLRCENNVGVNIGSVRAEPTYFSLRSIAIDID